MRRRMRKLTVILTAFTLVTAMAYSAGAVTLDEAEKKADELENQKEAVEEEKASLENRLASIIKQADETKQKLEEKEAEVEAVENELVQARNDADDQYESMKLRIKFMYEGGNTQMVEMLMSSESMGDFLNKAEYISQLSEYDRNELIRYQDTVKEVEKKEAQIQAEYEELNDLQNQLIDQQSEIETLMAENEAELADLQSQIDENSVTLKELQEKAAQAERIRQQQQQSSGSGGGTVIREPGESVVSGNGYFTHPCPGYTSQSSYFGEVRPFDPIPHKGHDYAAPAGTPTYAAAAGRVTMAGWSNSAGNWVVINHGNGLVTKYMHHSYLCVSTGDYVEKGQQIGGVGTTGFSTGNHLHFQVELNGVAVNPSNYL